MKIAQIRKQIVYVAAAVLAVLSEVVVPAKYASWAAAAVVVLGAIVHYQVPNAPAAAPPAAVVPPAPPATPGV